MIIIHWPFPLKPEQAVHRAYSEFAFFCFCCLFFPAHSKSTSQENDGLWALPLDGTWSTLPWDKLCHLDSLSLKRYLIVCKENIESFICNFSTHILVYLNPLVRCSVLSLSSYKEKKKQQTQNLSKFFNIFWIFKHNWLKKVTDSYYFVQEG